MIPRLSFTNRIIFAFFWLVIFVPLQWLHAQVNFAPISSSLGGAGIANLDQIEGSFLNPAVLPHFREFKIGGIFGQGSVYANQDDQVKGILLADCTTIIPGAFAYIDSNRTGLVSGEVHQKYYSLSLASFLVKGITFGVGLNRNESQLIEAAKFVENNFTLGILYSPISDFGLGLVLKNLANPSSEIPIELQLPETIGMGLFYLFSDKFHLRVDVGQEFRNNPEDKKFASFGVESRPLEYIAIRWGFGWDTLRERTLFTAGLGFVGPRLTMGYSFQNEIQLEGGPRHMFDIGLPF